MSKEEKAVQLMRILGMEYAYGLMARQFDSRFEKAAAASGKDVGDLQLFELFHQLLSDEILLAASEFFASGLCEEEFDELIRIHSLPVSVKMRQLAMETPSYLVEMKEKIDGAYGNIVKDLLGT